MSPATSNVWPAPTGNWVALPTPFRDDRIDFEALRRLVEHQIQAGSSGVVVAGTTGEAATLDLSERQALLDFVPRVAAGRIGVLAGVGTNDTRTTVLLSGHAERAGCDGLLVVTPFYNRPTQRGLVAHFTAVADAATRPVLLYNVPGRTACNLEAEATLALAEHPNIVGIKEASGDIGQISEILRHRPGGFLVFSGDDALTLPLVALGADGVISVVSNVAPDAMADLVSSAAAGELGRARALHHRLTPLMDFAFVDSNPIPIKRVLAEMGVCGPTVRSPLARMPDGQGSGIDQMLVALELIAEEAA